jgi:hypothetical protein
VPMPPGAGLELIDYAVMRHTGVTNLRRRRHFGDLRTRTGISGAFMTRSRGTNRVVRSVSDATRTANWHTPRALITPPLMWRCYR